MEKKKWDEENIEELFRQMPDIKDNRPKEDVYNRLKNDTRLHGSSANRKGKMKWAPLFAAAAAIIFISLLLPSMLKDVTKKTDSTSEVFMEKAEHSMNKITADTEEAAEESELAENEAASSYIVTADESAENTLFSIGLTSNAVVIPVNFLIPNEQIEADFPDKTPNSVDLYNQYALQVEEKELGFDEYHPYKGSLSFENGAVVHELPEDHSYDISSAAIQQYIESVRSTFIGFPRLLPVDKEKQPIEFNQIGTMEEIQIQQQNGGYAYYKYTLPSSRFYLVPNHSGEPAHSIKETLLSMKNNPNDLFDTVIPEAVNFTVEVEGDAVIIEFNEPLDLLAFEEDEAVLMIEGIMMAAEQFQLAVKLENVVQNEFGKYNFNEPLPRPVGVNPIKFSN